MRYLITTKCHSPFITKWYSYENNFNTKFGMIVYDLVENKYTIDGENWKDIEIDHL